MADYHRTEVRFPRAISHQLELLKKEVQEETGKAVSISDLVTEIVGQFFETSKKVRSKSEEHLLLKSEELKRESQFDNNS